MQTNPVKLTYRAIDFPPVFSASARADNKIDDSMIGKVTPDANWINARIDPGHLSHFSSPLNRGFESYFSLQRISQSLEIEIIMYFEERTLRV